MMELLKKKKKSLLLNTAAPKLGLKMNCQHQIRYQAECGYIFLVPLIPWALLRTVAGCAACEAPEPTGINLLSGQNNDSVKLYYPPYKTRRSRVISFLEKIVAL